MNDPFEEKLRAMRPGELPESLRQRLSGAPLSRAASNGKVMRIAFGLAAAACVTFVISRFSPPSTSLPPGAPVPSFAADREQRVTGLRSLAVVTDESNQRWKLVEVNWVEEQTLVSTTQALTVQLQNHRRAVVPVAIHFD